MLAFIKGKLVRISTDHIVVENNGIGYQIYVPFNQSTRMPFEGEDIQIFTFLNATENGITLYGFFNEEDRKMFHSLTGVSGIGPKGAISILSTLSSKDIIFAILNGDDKTISKSPGIGSKTAKRVILDLKDKLDITEDDLLDISDINNEVSFETPTGAVSDAIEALAALGYPYADAKRAVMSVENAKEKSVEELLSLALKEL